MLHTPNIKQIIQLSVTLPDIGCGFRRLMGTEELSLADAEAIQRGIMDKVEVTT
jgi:hypothetical protein